MNIPRKPIEWRKRPDLMGDIYERVDLPDHKMPNIIARIWAWIDGKKSLIGSSGGLIGVGLTKVPVPIAQGIGYILQAICWPLAGVGIAHKVGKISNYGLKGEFRKDDLASLINDVLALIIRIFNFLRRRQTK